MINRKLFLPSMLAILSGCASAPADIAPAMVDTSGYKKMTCEGLLLAAQNEGINLESVSKDQRSARNMDIALNILLIPGAGALTGDSERGVAEAKGRLLAIQNEFGSRCDGSEKSVPKV
ncbi:MAG: hypothetical protein NWR26_08125 [Pseudomonadales bacterium]|nr:hypothetical protein [Pseudomonadales bacterium]